MTKINTSDTRPWRVEIEGYPPYLYYGYTRAKVRMDVARDIKEAWDCKIIEALKCIKRVILATPHEVETVASDKEIVSKERELANG